MAVRTLSRTLAAEAPAVKAQPYSGVENLEIMREAENYNRYLMNTVVRHATPGPASSTLVRATVSSRAGFRDSGFSLTAIEPDDYLRQHLIERGIVAASNVAGLPDHSFDYIYTLNVLEHIEDDKLALRQLHEKLKAGGRLLIYVPAFPLLYSSMDTKVGHVRRYTRRELMATVEAAGFSVKAVAYVDSIGFLATLVFKLVGSKDGGVNRTALKAYDRLIFPLSRILDVFTGRWFGKNLQLLAGK